MTEAEKQAFALYEEICASGKDRPYSAGSVGEMMRKLEEWRASNPALTALSRATAEVRLAFLSGSFGWLRAEAKEFSRFQVCQAVTDAIRLVLTTLPKPLPAELVKRLLSEYRQDFSMTRMYFPFEQFLTVLTREQLTDEMRNELRRIHLQYAPSPTGKVEEHNKEIRELLAGLLRVEGEKELDPGRGPWSQIVVDEIAAKDDITRAGWEGLLEHCRALEQTVPGAKWKMRARELMAALGEAEVITAMLRWLAMGPTPGQPSEARSPIEDSTYQKGVVWCVAMKAAPATAIAIADFAIACLRKVPNLGAVSQKVGFACVQALGSMECTEAVGQLTRLRARVKYTVARRLIEKSLQQAAERSGLSIEEIEDICVAHYGLDERGTREIPLGDAKAIITLRDDGGVAVTWHNAESKLVKSAPAHIKKAFAKEVKDTAKLAKELEEAYAAQRVRLESSLMSARILPLKHWQEYFIEHPLLGFLGRRLIWVFSNGQGWERSGLWSGKEICDCAGRPLDLAKAEKVRLWHPLSSEATEVQQWRERIFAAGLRQPFRQAFREFYQITDEERELRAYSNRFAGVLMRQHQFASLCRERGWNYRLMGAGFDGGNVPNRKIDPWKMHVEFYVDLPADRHPSLRESGLGEQSGSGINLFITSDQVRFYRMEKEIALDDVPAIVYSEVMRDVDLFTSVCALGDDEGWADQGERGIGVFAEKYDPNQQSALISLRADLLSRVLPRTPIADRCTIAQGILEVRGQLGTYRIFLNWGIAMLITESKPRWLRIPQKVLNAVELGLQDLPLDLDHRTEMILRKAYILANDWNIDSPDLVKQLMPK
ncbi:MAG TPA: DUF4132 domain-containing protein [Terriglobales bacterium]|nr:DUF4132 domain-containing protein [Terriglobales bacterium]